MIRRARVGSEHLAKRIHLVGRECGKRLVGNDDTEGFALMVIDEARLGSGMGVGVCDSSGSAQRLYVKRGYIPDGSGGWYRDRQCVQSETVCTVDDDLVLFLYKKLQEERTGKEH